MTSLMHSVRRLCLLSFLLLFSFQTLAASIADNTLDQVMQRGELIVAVSILPPWVMKNKQGKLIGFEIDIANQLARDMGVKVTFKQYPWKAMIPALKKGEVDIIASGLSITPKRALEINFSDPYGSSGYSLVTNLDLTKDFTSIKDLDSDKVFIAALDGTVSAELVKKVFPKARLDTRKSEKDATSAVVNGTVHAFVSSSPVPEFIALKHPKDVDLPLKNPLLTTKEAFAVRKNNQEMLNFLNAWIIAHKADDWIDSSHQYWFNSLKWQRQVED